MDEKLDLKSKYEKLRKKYVQLKQQAVTLKESLKTKEDEFEYLKSSFDELEKKHKDSIANLDASQYKEAQLKREMEEIVCQLELFKLNGGVKQEQPAGQANKVGQGILTGLLPMNGVVMNFQKNERLEEKVVVLQEELDLKILENEQLLIKEFDMKKQHQKTVEEHIANNTKLKNEIDNLHLEISQLKKKREKDNDILDELSQLKEKDRVNSQKITELLDKINLIENSKNEKLKRIRMLLPPVNLSQLEESYFSWIKVCKQNSSFYFLKLESLISEFLRVLLFFVGSWGKCVDHYTTNPPFQDKVISRICQKIHVLLEEVNKNLIDSSGGVVFQSEFILEHNIVQPALSYDVNGGEKLVRAEMNDVIVERSINAMKAIKHALNLQIVVFKMELHKLSRSNLSAGFQCENKMAISELFKIISSLKKHLSKLNCLINFALYLGKEPDLIYTHTFRTDSFYTAFVQLFKGTKDCFDLFCVEIEEKKLFLDFLQKILIEDITFQDQSISLNESFISSHKKLIELESLRKGLHTQVSIKIKHNIGQISAELKDSCRILESLFLSGNSTLPFFNYTSKDALNSLCNSILEISQLLSEKKEYFWELISSLYQHPSVVCQSAANFNDLQIVIREAKSKLENAPLKAAPPELHVLNKRIEQLEESRKEQLETINNLMNQLNSARKCSNLDNHNSGLNSAVPSAEVISDYSRSESGALSELRKTKSGNMPQRYTHGVFESQLREANETLEHTVTRLQLRINDLNDDIEVTRQSYDEQISLLSQHICSLSDKLALTDASTLSSFNQEILCYSCESWTTLDIILNRTKGACQKCKTKLLRLK